MMFVLRAGDCAECLSPFGPESLDLMPAKPSLHIMGRLQMGSCMVMWPGRCLGA
jgi:hypothetical protein